MDKKLMFRWEDTTPEQCEEFNRWTQADKLKVKTTTSLKGIENLNRFLNADREGGLGNFILQFLLEERENHETNSNYLIESEMIFKTVIDNDEIISVMAFNKVVDTETTINCMLIAVNPEKQAQGYGAAIALEMVKHPDLIFGIKGCKFTAFIDKNNLPSQKIFLGANFTENKTYFEKFTKRGLKPKTLKFAKDVNLDEHAEELEALQEQLATKFIAVEHEDVLSKEDKAADIKNILNKKLIAKKDQNNNYSGLGTK